MAFAQLCTRVLILLALICALYSNSLLVKAQSLTSSALAATATRASVYPGTSNWEYYGCYNETTLINGTGGLRALNGGAQEVLESMTVDLCLEFCKSGGFAFAGLEYTKECYCAQYLSSLSAKVDDSACDLACVANNTEICGGALKLTVYQAKNQKKGAGSKIVREAPVGSILALGIAMGVLLCLA